MAEIVQIHEGGRTADIADRLEAEAENQRSFLAAGAIRNAAALIRDLDKAIAHTVAVKGSQGLSPWAVSVLHDAVARQQARGNA